MRQQLGIAPTNPPDALRLSDAANPSASVGLAAINGVANTWMRSDAAPALNVAIAPTWTGAHTWTVAGSGVGIAVNNSGTAQGVLAQNTGTGTAIVTTNTSTGSGIYALNSSTGGVAVNAVSTSTGGGIGLVASSAGTAAAISATNTGGGGPAISATAGGSGRGLAATSSGAGAAVYAANSSTGYALYVTNTGAGPALYVAAGPSTLQAITATSGLFSGGVGISGNAAPAQVTGWGTPTGPAVVANFSGTAATLVNCSNAIAKIITDLKAFGLYGA